MNIYVCVTLYHVYITLLLIFSTKTQKQSIILLSANDPWIYEQYKYIAHQLKKKGFNCDLRYRTNKTELLGLEKIKNRIQYRMIKKIMGERGVQNYILYNFAWNISYIYSTVALLYKKCEQAIFIEEGVFTGTLGEEKKWKKLFHKYIYGGNDFYKDDKLKEIRVQRPDLFPENWKSKLVELKLSEMIYYLDDVEKKEIISIISQESEKINLLLSGEKVGIIYSCPTSENGQTTEEEKICFTLRLCEFYKQYGRVILKLHPRDKSTYPVDKETMILSGGFPSELLTLVGYKFKFAVALCSSAVETTNAEYRINMNENFTKDRKLILRDIHGEVVQN